MTIAAHASPLAKRPLITAVEGDRVIAEYSVDPDEPLLRGHYPGFPIFPGVCLVDCILQTALEHDGALRLRSIASTRFKSPVFPGEKLTVELDWDVDGPRWNCRATVTGEHGTAVQARLVFGKET
ncbi:hypothetical protein GCM10027447_37420 [Glycomyces halotolerans]